MDKFRKFLYKCIKAAHFMYVPRHRSLTENLRSKNTKEEHKHANHNRHHRQRGG